MKQAGGRWRNLKTLPKNPLFFDLTTEASDWSPHSSIYPESIKVDLGPERDRYRFSLQSTEAFSSDSVSSKCHTLDICPGISDYCPELKMYALEFKVQTLSVIEVNHCSLAENNDLLSSVSVIDLLITSASNLGN